jgi:hypothetical protein
LKIISLLFFAITFLDRKIESRYRFSIYLQQK